MGKQYALADRRLPEPFEFTLAAWTEDNEVVRETFTSIYQMDNRAIAQITGMLDVPHKQVELVRRVIGSTLPNDDGTPANWKPVYRPVRYADGEPDRGEQEFRAPDGEWYRAGTEDVWTDKPSTRRRFFEFYDHPDLILDIGAVLMPLVRDLAAVSAGRPLEGS